MATSGAREESSLVGNIHQLGYLRRTVLAEGNGAGMEIVDVRSASGIDATVFPQRGLDIGDVFFKGNCLSFITPTGAAHPNRYDPHGLGWLQTFSGGLLTTCGLSYLGPPGEDVGQSLGLHGRYSSLAATEVWVRSAYGAPATPGTQAEAQAPAATERGAGSPGGAGGPHAQAATERGAGSPGGAGAAQSRVAGGGPGYVRARDEARSHSIGGIVEEASLFGPRLRMERRIDISGDRPRIVISDTVSNFGFEPSPFTILYHMNLGYPLLAPEGRLYVTSRMTHAHSDTAEATLDSWSVMREPRPGVEEELFLHEVDGDSDGMAHAVLVRPDGEMALHISFPADALPLLTQWKLMKSGEYALGVEPANVPVMNRSDLRSKGLLPTLAPEECWEAVITAEVCEGASSVTDVLKRHGLSEANPPTTPERYGP